MSRNDRYGSRVGATPEGGLVPGVQNLKAWTFDTLLASGAVALTKSTVHFAKMTVAAGQRQITELLCYVSTAGAGLTADANFGAVFDAAGNLVGLTADQSAAWQTVGVKAMTLVSGPGLVTPEQPIVGCLLTNGITAPLVRSVTGSLSSLTAVGLSAAEGYRFGTWGAGLVTMPALLPIAAGASSSAAPWMAVR